MLLDFVNSNAALFFRKQGYACPMGKPGSGSGKRKAPKGGESEALPQDDKLEPWQREDAERLRGLWKRYRDDGGLTQGEFAETFGLKSQSNFGHYLHGRRPLNLTAVIGLAKGMGKAIEDISPTIADQVDEAFTLARKSRASETHAIAEKVRIEVTRQLTLALEQKPATSLGEPTEQPARFGNGARH